MKFTEPQRRALQYIADENDNGRGFNHSVFRIVNLRTLERLLAMGAITSAKPFSWSFHTVYLTEAGREWFGKAKND